MASRYDISLQVDNLSLSRGEMPLVANLSFTVNPGQAIWLTGPNGIGKTSLLLACAGLLTPDEGAAHWVLHDQAIPPRAALAYAAHRGPERSGLTLGEDLSFWQSLNGDQLGMEDRLQAVGLQGRQNVPVAGLSAGQRRRLSLARLLASDRAAWLMDEPLAGLDADGRRLVTDCVSTHLSRGGLVMIASHQPVPIKDVEALKLVMEPSSSEGGL
jgi:heme exporter protein A